VAGDSDERNRRARETLDALHRVHPSNHPSFEDIARLHDIHAQHEREVGNEGRAAAAEERARRARSRAG
jgi:hypothetical protein